MSNGKQARIYSLLNFDEWMNLAKDNPDKFEQKRREQIEMFFENIPKDRQRRLKGLQWKIDQTRRLSRSPMASCIAISNMMWDSLGRLNEHHCKLTHFLLEHETREKTKQTNATILKINANTRH